MNIILQYDHHMTIILIDDHMLIIIVTDDHHDHKVKYVGCEARVIDGHKCGPSGLRVAGSQQLEHLRKT